MVRKCCVQGCNSNYDAVLRYSMSPISTFKFPDDPDLRSRWVQAVQRPEGWTPGRTACICIHHFQPEDILKADKPAKLKPDAVPLICEELLKRKHGPLIKRGRPKKSDAKSKETNSVECFGECEGADRLGPVGDLMEELILDFEDFTLRVEKTDSFEGWHHYRKGSVLHFYNIADENDDRAIQVENSFKIFADMTIYLFVREINQTDECLKSILGQELKLRRWSQFETILQRYDHILDTSNDLRDENVLLQAERTDDDILLFNEDDSLERESGKTEVSIEDENSHYRTNVKIVNIEIEEQTTSCEQIEFLSMDTNDQANDSDCMSLLRKNPLGTGKRRTQTTDDKCERRHVRDTIKALKMVRHKCFICDQEHENMEELEHHLPSHVDMLPYCCQRCVTQDVTLTTLASLNKHFLMHLKPLKCRTCDVRFSSYGTRLLHEENSHVNKGPIPCEFCGKILRSSRGYQHHVKVHSNPEAVKCQVCEKQLSSSYELKLHLRVHTKEKPNKCPFCSASFNRVSNLVAHKRRFHSKEKPFVCPDCNDRFRTSLELKRHAAAHNPESCDAISEKQNRRLNSVAATDLHKLYHCKVCDKHLPTRISYHSHMRKHRKRYQCSFCGLQIGQRRDFIDHENTHTGNRPYKCEICSKRFQTSSTYYGHRTIHSGIKRFACNDCDRRFSRLSHLIVHKKTHSAPKEEQFVCKSCNKTYADRGAYNMHLESHKVHQQSLKSAALTEQAQTSITFRTVSEATPYVAIRQASSTTEQVQQFIHTNDGQEAILVSADVIVPHSIIILQQ
ncbi:zinc finger protein 436-like [Sabethes cyaneus]|uniref:zinc finger protein 436-like n=1 Tax=Sabethes cyaneus TaxID=53552 RepID=UPI00237DFF17|nr:zinc finger protein 436-like [Sabethes cyaneus]